MDAWKGRALQRMRREISTGSSDRIPSQKLESTRQNLTDNFQDKTEEHWMRNQRNVRRLSRLAGSLALIASWGKGHQNNDTPATVEDSHVDGAIALVANVICPGIPGAYCTNYLDDQYQEEAEEVGGLLEYVLGKELDVEARRPMDRSQRREEDDEWDEWETALDDTLEAMEDHAALRVGDGLDVVRTKLAPFYRDSSADEWNAAKDPVLRLAALAGALSSAATILDPTSSHWPPHKIVNDHLFGSIAILARHLCPVDDDKIRGGYCPDFLADEYDPMVDSVRAALAPVT